MTRGTCIAILLAAMVYYFSAPNRVYEGAEAQQLKIGLSSVSSGSDSATATPTGSVSSGAGVQTVDSTGKRIRCTDMPEAKGGVILGYIVPCLSRTIENTTVLMSQRMSDWLRPLFYAYLTIVVVFFGVKVLMNEGEVHKEGFLLLIKVTLVIAFLELIPQYMVPVVYDTMTESQQVVAGMIGTDNSSFHCDVAKYRDGNSQLIWAQMDCLMGKLYGITVGGTDPVTGAKKPSMLLASSVLGLMTGFLFGGTFGVIVFLACIGVLWSILMLIVRTAMAFLNGYLIICIMLIIAPLFLPLVLMNVTRNYFEPWWKAILGAMILPVVITSYSLFAMLMYDKMLFAPDALINKLFDYSEIQNALKLPEEKCTKPATGSLGSLPKNMPLREFISNSLHQNTTEPSLSSATKICIPKTVLEISDMKDPRFKDAQKALAQMFHDCIKLFILGVLISMGLQSVMNAVRQLVGSQPASRSLASSSKLEQQLQAGMQGAQKGMAASFNKKDEKGETISGTVNGADFLKRLTQNEGGVLDSTAKGFMRGMGKSE